MNRLSLPVWLVVVLAAGFCMFQIKFAVQGLEHQLGQTNHDIQRAQESIRVLKAEWSYLNEPGRLADLNRRFLGLTPVSARQMTALASLPPRFDVALAAPSLEPGLRAQAAPVAGDLSAAIDRATTGFDIGGAADRNAGGPAPSGTALVALGPAGLMAANLAERDLVSFAPAPADLALGGEDMPAGAPPAATVGAAEGPMTTAGAEDPLGALIASSVAESQ